MKRISFILCGFFLCAVVGLSEVAKIGDQADYSLTIIRQYGIQFGSTGGSNEITDNIQFSGGYTCVPNHDAGDFDASSADFSSRLRKLVEAEGWSMTSFQLMSSKFPPRRLYVLARKNGVWLDISVCMFPMEGGRMGIAYTQGTK